jgi:hypothetical protein
MLVHVERWRRCFDDDGSYEDVWETFLDEASLILHPPCVHSSERRGVLYNPRFRDRDIEIFGIYYVAIKDYIRIRGFTRSLSSDGRMQMLDLRMTPIKVDV